MGIANINFEIFPRYEGEVSRFGKCSNVLFMNASKESRCRKKRSTDATVPQYDLYYWQSVLSNRNL